MNPAFTPAFLLAVDPGASGGYCLRDPYTGSIDKLGKRPATCKELHDILIPLVGSGVVLIEEVHASPVMGISSAFTFGREFERWLTAAGILGIPIYGVTPQQWQRGLPLTGDPGNRKAALSALAKDSYRHLTGITLATCDALLISGFGVAQLQAGKLPGRLLDL
jgi:hypothetical protein